MRGDGSDAALPLMALMLATVPLMLCAILVGTVMDSVQQALEPSMT